MPNRLANETSPYLRQHKDNPVDWYPWGDGGAGAGARRRTSRCCQHRLFSLPLVPRHGARVVRGPGTAALMNEHYIYIKVDREERPDIDSLYMTAVQAMSGQGGWP